MVSYSSSSEYTPTPHSESLGSADWIGANWRRMAGLWIYCRLSLQSEVVEFHEQLLLQLPDRQRTLEKGNEFHVRILR